MSLSEDITCRLCLKRPLNEFVLIDETLRQGLDALMVKMNFDVNNVPLMCKDCMENFQSCLSFILVCLKSEKNILLFNTGKDKINIDLRDVLAHNSKRLVNRDASICRFCIKEVEGTNCIPLKDVMKEDTYLDMFREYTFKMDQNVVENPLICFHCRDDIENYLTFLLRCFVTEQKIDVYCKNEAIRSGVKIVLGSVFQQFSKSTLEYPERRTQFYEVKKELSIEAIAKTEITDWIEIVKEEFATEDVGIYNSLLHQTADTGEHELCSCDTKVGTCLWCRTRSSKVPLVADDIKMESVSLEMNGELQIKSEELHIKDEVDLSEGTDRQSDARKFGICLCNKSGRCSKCNSRFDVVSTGPNVDMLGHQYIPEEMMYKCMTCDYKTKRKRDIKRHSLTHKAKADLTLYKCTACDFKTIHKKSLTNHSLIHKTEADLQMFKCTTCDYKTIRKGDLKIHSLTHKTKAELTMYKCADCDFETKHKHCLKKHSLTHKTELELTMYKCADCDHKTKHKDYLKKHLLIHKTKPGVLMKE